MEQTAGLRLSLRFKTLSKLMGQTLNSRITALGLTSSQAYVLGYLYCRGPGPVYPRDVERHFGFTHPTVSGLLQRLEAKGFLTAESSPDDRRYKRIELTQQARQIYLQVENEIRRTEELLTAGFSAVELTLLDRLLDRLISNLASEREEGGTCL